MRIKIVSGQFFSWSVALVKPYRLLFMSRINSLSILVIASIWLLFAVISWHQEAQCGPIFGRVCIDFIVEGIKWVAFFKWIAPYQTLLAGIAAIAGALGAIHAARLTIWSSREMADRRAREQVGIDAGYLSEFFRQSSHLQIHSDFKSFTDRWDDVQTVIKRLILVNAEFSVDCLYVWGSICDGARSRPTYWGLAALSSQAAIAAFVLEDIRKFHLETPKGRYDSIPLKCSTELCASLHQYRLYAQLQNLNATVSALTDRMSRYVELPDGLL